VKDQQSTARVRLGVKGSPGDRPDSVRIRLLGGFSVSVGTRTIQQDEWRLKKAAALIKLLALAPGHNLHRERAMDLLWPNLGTRAASNNLRQVLYGARRVLDPTSEIAHSRYLNLQDEHLILCPQGQLWVDVETFEEAAATARHAQDPAAYRVAIDLYAGDLLPEDRYEEWAEVHRRQLRQTYLSLLIGLARLYEERGEHEPAVEALQSAVAEEPANEEVHARLMRLYALDGHVGEALAQYTRLEEVLLKELGTEPAASSRALREEIAAGRFPPQEASFLGSVPPEAPVAGKHNLPAPRTSFVGREREMVEVKRALAMTRLLTLTGAGGSGKTRLALEVARDLVGAYPDGVWLVELAGLSDSELVPRAVAGALGVLERPGQPLTNTLAENLRVKSLLLVLDNCEHLADSVAHVLDTLLDSCPRLRVLATSREALGLAGEVVWQVPLLTVPETDRLPALEEMTRYEAVRLFVERARLRVPGFELTLENVPEVSNVCRKLEGIPLAIELAAARVGTLSAAQIAARLDDSLRLLTAGGRTTVPRQRTLRGTLDWSHELLSELERILFRRLSVFAGGWSLEAAELIVSKDGIHEGDVLDLLCGLVDKSLVVSEMAIAGGVRYGLLEPIHQYASEMLKESGEAKVVKSRHAQWCLALAEEAEPGLLGPEEATWLRRLEAEHDNLRAALSWSLGGGDTSLGLRMVAALRWFWNAGGYYSEGATWIERALAKSGAAYPTARAGALIGLGRILSRRGDFVRAEEHLKEALSLCKELGDRRRVAEALNVLGWATFFEGENIAQAKALLEESLAAARESGNTGVIPSVLNSLASIALENRDFELARELWGEALLLNWDRGRASLTSRILLNSGYTELAMGNRERAADLIKDALALGRELGDKYVVAGCLLSLGIAATLRDEPKRAERLIKEGLAINLELEGETDTAEFLEGLAEAAGALQQDLRAARLWGAAAALRKAADWPWWNAERLLHESLLATARSRVDEAAWETAFEEGQAMSFGEAVEYALSDEEATTASSQAPDQPLAHEQPPSLTRREQEVAVLVTRGLTNRQIASQLSISEHTVESHVAKILKKLGADSRTQIAAWATQQGLPKAPAD
jgi:predicted ATPase/DNA-binding SARP family transcriptional activator/DNA-binding CsgD family transcriptional regulator